MSHDSINPRALITLQDGFLISLHSYMRKELDGRVVTQPCRVQILYGVPSTVYLHAMSIQSTFQDLPGGQASNSKSKSIMVVKS